MLCIQHECTLHDWVHPLSTCLLGDRLSYLWILCTPQPKRVCRHLSMLPTSSTTWRMQRSVFESTRERSSNVRKSSTIGVYMASYMALGSWCGFTSLRYPEAPQESCATTGQARIVFSSVCQTSITRSSTLSTQGNGWSYTLIG